MINDKTFARSGILGGSLLTKTKYYSLCHGSWAVSMWSHRLQNSFQELTVTNTNNGLRAKARTKMLNYSKFDSILQIPVSASKQAEHKT